MVMYPTVTVAPTPPIFVIINLTSPYGDAVESVAEMQVNADVNKTTSATIFLFIFWPLLFRVQLEGILAQ